MDNRVDICKRRLNSIHEALEFLLIAVGDAALARPDRVEISNFEINYNNFVGRIAREPVDVEGAISSAENAAIHAQALGSNIKNRGIYSDEVVDAGRNLEAAAVELKSSIDSGQEFFTPYKLSIEPISQQDSAGIEGSMTYQERKIIELEAKLRADIEGFERDITKGKEDVNDIARKNEEGLKKIRDEYGSLQLDIDILRSEISKLNDYLVAEVKKAEKISKDAQERSDDINSQIDGMLGQTASKVLLVDYANTADIEGKAADKFRVLAVTCMATTGLVLLVALFESMANGLDWKQAIVKLLAAIALSVPAAYLARESARHRSQEHLNRKISLDLKALTPYIATLPIEEQNKIKSEVASRIFGAQDGGASQTDNYPINVQELAKLLIEKIPTQK